MSGLWHSLQGDAAPLESGGADRGRAGGDGAAVPADLFHVLEEHVDVYPGETYTSILVPAW